MSKCTVTFHFDDTATRHGFLVWFLDCAGGQHYWKRTRKHAPIAEFRDWPEGFPAWMKDIPIQAPTAQRKKPRSQ